MHKDQPDPGVPRIHPMDRMCLDSIHHEEVREVDRGGNHDEEVREGVDHEEGGHDEEVLMEDQNKQVKEPVDIYAGEYSCLG